MHALFRAIILTLLFSFQRLVITHATPIPDAIPPGAVPATPQDADRPEEKPNRNWKISSYVAGNPNPAPKLVYRVDYRDPDHVFTHGMTTREKSPTPHGYDLSRHVFGSDSNLKDTNYISTTKSPTVAEKFGKQPGLPSKFWSLGAEEAYALAQHNIQKGVKPGQPLLLPPVDKLPAHPPIKDMWVYVIQPDKSYINVFQTLGPDGYPTPDFIGQQEFAVIRGKIEAERIIGAYQVNDAKRMIRFNPAFNPTFRGQRAGVGHPEVAHDSNAQAAAKIIADADAENESFRTEASKSPKPKPQWRSMPLSQFIPEYNSPLLPNHKADTSKTPKNRPCKRGLECDFQDDNPDKLIAGNKNEAAGENRRVSLKTGLTKSAAAEHLGGVSMALVSMALTCRAHESSTVEQQPPPQGFFQSFLRGLTKGNLSQVPGLLWGSAKKLGSQENVDAFAKSSGDLVQGFTEIPNAVKSRASEVTSAENFEAFAESADDLVNALSEVPEAVANGTQDVAKAENFHAFGKSLTDFAKAVGEIPAAAKSGFDDLTEAPSEIATTFQKAPSQLAKATTDFMKEYDQCLPPGSNGRKIVDSMFASLPGELWIFQPGLRPVQAATYHYEFPLPGQTSKREGWINQAQH
ncbi:hypothetical protein DCS_04235 [Drechmeria coniospora]|uniref:Uncharacterized protein n=1 Tax=Drechmeria coniospora TaxID=98403 RepID=A0A151GJG9_DRECN|nr:hypothetical protein DCS_04235 [Drechmeria coniospora]KYK57228.1 hypothetical protein DCS_04235 [Drechmeria coniospora]